MRQTIPISKEFFCDGHGYLLTSQSLGGSDLTPEQVSEIMFSGDDEQARPLLEKGVCIPVAFEGDCALDHDTLFVIGDLTEEEEKNWIGRLAWKLNIPCGKMILCCGCCEDELIPATAGEPPEEHYVIYEFIDVPPGEYLVEIFAYFASMTVQLLFPHYDEDEYEPEDFAAFDLDEAFFKDKEKHDWYKEHYPGGGRGYVIRLSPLEKEPPMPKLSGGWFEEFEFRSAKL